jgi:hypothetical protein
MTLQFVIPDKAVFPPELVLLDIPMTIQYAPGVREAAHGMSRNLSPENAVAIWFVVKE